MTHVVRIIWGLCEGNAYPLEEGAECRAGRTAQNQIVLDQDPTTSGSHAMLRVSQGLTYLLDLNSTNGTLCEGVRLSPKEWHRVNQFFVLGASVFVVGHQAAPLNLPPMALTAATAWHTLPLYQEAVALAAEMPFVSSAHLFLALLKLERRVVAPFLKHINVPIDLNNWQQMLSGGQLFSGNLAWLNKPLEVSSRGNRQPPLLTPLAQHLLQRYAEQPDPAKLFHRMVDDDFNMIHVLLEWQRTKPSWDMALHQAANPGTLHKTTNTRDQAFQEALIYKNLWEELAAISANHRIPVLAGSAGIGKSYLLRRMAHGATRVLLKPPLKASPIRLIDPKEFLLYNPPKMLGRYFKDLKRELKSEGLVMLDHIDTLIQTIIQHDGDLLDLATAIVTSNPNLLLVCQSDSVPILRDQIPMIQPVDMDEYLKPHLETIHGEMLTTFQKELGGTLSEVSRQFFHTQVAARSPRDLRRIREYLDICLLRMRNLGSMGDLAEGRTTSFGRLGDHLMREVFQDWIGPEPAAQPSQDHSHEEQVLLEIERFLFQFSIPMIKIPLRYGPSSTSFAADSNLPREHKLEMLKEHLLKLIASFKLGFRDWFEAYWNEASPDGLKRKVGTNDRKLWREYEELAKLIDQATAEEQLREACKERWTSIKQSDLWKL